MKEIASSQTLESKSIVGVKQRNEWWNIWAERNENSDCIYSLAKRWSFLDLLLLLLLH